MDRIRLGLIGDSIARSQSPRLHRLAGELCGLDVSYERLVPPDLGLSFDAVFDRCVEGGYRGINVTYPYKELVVAKLDVSDEGAARLGACNTVIFDGPRPHGFNTDRSGFIAGWRGRFGQDLPGRVAMAGAGGVGKAIAFALDTLGATHLSVFDPDRAKAEALAASLRNTDATMTVAIDGSIDEACDGASGLINCTPLGMTGKPGTAFPARLMRGASWAFDAVYTPVDTEFLDDARAARLETLSGYELFFHQGVDAFRLFTGRDVDHRALRAALAQPQTEAAA
jgi:shikimate dehydrogenase